ncbi:hypothetical protein V6N13_014265 [Hibiscus sabdariffa]|uniref:Uncharacterized protein n=1 Tax=Hibiscus sabdariffa TaxID=183260 RepID=A0ABR2RVE2_9ROSI
MGASSLRPWLICLAIISMVAVEEVLQVVAAATPSDGGISDLSYNRRLLQVPANPYSRGCSRFVSMVAVEELLQVAAAATSSNGGISDLSYNRRLLQVPANPYSRGCSRFARCRSGRRGPPGVQS